MDTSCFPKAIQPLSVIKVICQPASQRQDRGCAHGGGKVLSAGSGLGFRSTLLLLTQQKGTEFSDLFRVSFANLPKRGEVSSALQHLPRKAPANTRRRCQQLNPTRPKVLPPAPPQVFCCRKTAEEGFGARLTPHFCENEPSNNTRYTR